MIKANIKYLFSIALLFFTLQFACQKSVLIVDLEQRLSVEDSKEIQVKIYLDLAHLYSTIDQKLSLDYAEKALLISNSTKSSEDKIKALVQIGRIELKRNNYDVALETFIKALDINKENANLPGIAKCRLLMGDVYKKIGDKRWAKKEYEMALKIGIKTKSSYVTALSNFSIGKLEKSLGNKRLALELIELSNDQVNEEENQLLKAEISRVLGQTYVDMGKPFKGIGVLKNSLSFYVSVDSILYNGPSSNQAEVTFDLAKAYELVDDHVNFLSYMEKSLALSEKLALKNYIKKGYKNIAKAYGLNKEYAKAYEFLQYYAAIKDVSEINFLESQLELAKKNQKLVLIEEKQKNEEEIKFTRNLFFIVILILLLIFSGFLLYAYRQKSSINNELEEATLQSNKLRQDKEDFFAYTSHEIRTPLNAVVGLSQLMAETKLTNKQRDYLETINTSANNILFLVNDILDLTKIEKGAIQLEETPFSLVDIANEIAKSVSFKTEGKPVEVQHFLSADIPNTVVGDPMRINQILLNLVDNAIKFTEQGSVTITIEPAKDYSNSGKIIFSIVDTVIVIKKEKLASIFDSYEQASTNTSRQYGGTGLGLAITRELVRLMGGEVKVTSQTGVGSEFSFGLILKKSTLQKPVFKKTEQSKINYNGISILIVDDNELNRIVLNELIQNMKQRISLAFAEDGLEAVNMVKNETYDLVLMDLQMPNMNGFEATKQIRTKLPSNKRNIPIVAMTAHVVDGIAKKCLEVGMNDCLSKPIKTELLFNKIASVLNLPEKATDLTKDKNGTSNSKKSQVTNLKLINQISKGDSKKITKYINIYLDNIPKDLKGFNAAINEGDYETMSSLAHKIKGNASYLGVESVIKDLTLLEKTNGSSENTNEITNIAKRVTSILEQSLIELNQHILE